MYLRRVIGRLQPGTVDEVCNVQVMFNAEYDATTNHRVEFTVTFSERAIREAPEPPHLQQIDGVESRMNPLPGGAGLDKRGTG